MLSKDISKGFLMISLITQFLIISSTLHRIKTDSSEPLKKKSKKSKKKLEKKSGKILSSLLMEDIDEKSPIPSDEEKTCAVQSKSENAQSMDFDISKFKKDYNQKAECKMYGRNNPLRPMINQHITTARFKKFIDDDDTEYLAKANEGWWNQNAELDNKLDEIARSKFVYNYT
jgi:hypothetical protein